MGSNLVLCGHYDIKVHNMLRFWRILALVFLLGLSGCGISLLLLLANSRPCSDLTGVECTVNAECEPVGNACTTEVCGGAARGCTCFVFTEIRCPESEGKSATETFN